MVREEFGFSEEAVYGAEIRFQFEIRVLQIDVVDLQLLSDSDGQSSLIGADHCGHFHLSFQHVDSR